MLQQVPGTPIAPRATERAPILVRARSLVALTKPRIIELLLITTIPTMIVAERGLPPAGLMAATVTGGMFAAGGANALNMYIDRDIDRLMLRTQHRPLVTGVLSPRTALVFALSLELVAFVELSTLVNVLSAILAAAATAFYVGVYTLWLKRTSRQNIVIGGAAGAVPVLIGWSSVTGRLGWTPLVLFALIFLWTPPHFWALAMKYRADYRAAGVPMLPAVTSAAVTARWILRYSIVMVAVSLAYSSVANTGLIYSASALVLGAGFILLSVRMWRDPSPSASMQLFGYSITYLSMLFVAIAVDQLVRIT